MNIVIAMMTTQTLAGIRDTDTPLVVSCVVLMRLPQESLYRRKGAKPLPLPELLADHMSSEEEEMEPEMRLDRGRMMENIPNIAHPSL